MYLFSANSNARLMTCHIDLQTIMLEVIKGYDCTIICGHRDEAAQNEAFEKGFSKLKWPNGEHNKLPSMAVDVIPSPFKGWENREQFIYMAGYIKSVADKLLREGKITHKIRCGIDFNGDLNFKNDKLFDGPHIELVK